MTIRIGIVSIAACAAALLAAAPVQAHEPYFRLVDTPLCDDAAMLKKISVRFRHQARHVHHDETLQIVDYTPIGETRFRDQDAHQARPVPRRYCSARAHFNDGRERTVWYLIEGGAGFAARGSNVEFCVSGFDRWNVYNAACRVLR